MVFRRIDRYVGWSFLTRFVGGAALLACLYIGFDLLKRLDEIQATDDRQSVLVTAQYYACLLPGILLDLVPALVLMAAGLVLVRMSSRRELLALKASGTSVHRIVVPLFVWTLAISVLVFAARETVLPGLTRRRVVLGNRLEHKEENRVVVEDQPHDRVVHIGHYRGADGLMQLVHVFDFLQSAGEARAPSLRRLIGADSAVLADGMLVLKGVHTYRVYSSERTPGEEAAVLDAAEIAIPTGLTAFDIDQAAREEEELNALLLPLSELRRRIAGEPHTPVYRVAFHWKLASFFSPFVLLLVGMPCLVGTGGSINSRFLGSVLCILLAAGYYVLTFVFNSFGKTDALHAAVAGWFPIIIVGSLGLYLFESRLA